MKLIRNILTTLAGRIAILALGLISSILLARILGPEGRGVFALVLLLPGLGLSLGRLGFEQANAVYAGLEPRGRRALVWQSAAIAGAVGGIIAIGCMSFVVLGAPGFPALLRAPLWLYVLPLLMVPGMLVTEYWRAIIRGMNRIGLLNVVEVGQKAASLFLIVVFVAWLRLDVAGAVWANVAVDAAAVVLMVALLRSVGVWGRPSFDRPLWTRTVRFALPAHGGTLAAYLNYRVDELVIAMLLPPEQLGFYVIAVGLAERLWVPSGAIATALLPHLTNTPERDPALPAVIARHVIVWVGAACLLVFGLADVVIRVLYSSAFAAAVAPLRWLLPGIFALSVGKVLVGELLAREKPRYTVWASSVAAFVNIVGNLLLVPRMGISGAALSSSISYCLLSLILIWYYLRETGVPWTELVPRRSDLVAYGALWARAIRAVPAGIGTHGGTRP